MGADASNFPTQTVSSGGTLGFPHWRVGDAVYAAIRVTSASTAPGLTLFGSMVDSTSTGNFLRLGIMYSTGNDVVTASSGTITMACIAGMQRIALGTSAASTGGITIEGSKFIEL